MILAVICAIAAAEPEPGSRKDVAYINVEPSRWTLGTAAVERVVALEDGKLLLKSLKDKSTGRELVSSAQRRRRNSSSASATPRSRHGLHRSLEA